MKIRSYAAGFSTAVLLCWGIAVVFYLSNSFAEDGLKRLSALECEALTNQFGQVSEK